MQNFNSMSASITKQSHSSQKLNAQLALQKEQQFFGTPREVPKEELKTQELLEDDEESFEEVDMDQAKNQREIIMQNYRNNQRCLDDSSSSSVNYSHSDAPYMSNDGEEGSKNTHPQEESFRINDSLHNKKQNNSYADFQDPYGEEDAFA